MQHLNFSGARPANPPSEQHQQESEQNQQQQEDTLSEQHQQRHQELRSKQATDKRKETMRPPKKRARPTANVEEEKEEEEEPCQEEAAQEKPKYLKTCMSPKLMHELIQQFSPQQKEAVQEIGFESLLHLNISNAEGLLIKYVVDNFDIYRCALKLEEDELLIEEEDIHCTLGLLRGQRQVEEGPKNESTGNEEYKTVLQPWRQRWNIENGSPITTTMGHVIANRGDSGDMFKRDFFVFTVSSLLRGYQSQNSNYRILHSLINVNEIKELNYCSYTYKSVIKSIKAFKIECVVHVLLFFS